MLYKSGKLSRYKKCKEDPGDRIITYVYRPNWLGKLLRREDKQVSYIGGGTVWYSYPDFIRCGTITESQLAMAYKKYEYFRQKRARQVVEQIRKLQAEDDAK